MTRTARADRIRTAVARASDLDAVALARAAATGVLEPAEASASVPAEAAFVKAAARWPLLLFVPHEEQARVWRSGARWKAARGGNRSGKTEGLVAEGCSYSSGVVPAVFQCHDGPGHGMGIVPAPVHGLAAADRVSQRLGRLPDGRRTMPVPNHGWICSRSYQITESVILPLVRRYIPPDWIRRIDIQKGTVEIKNDSIIWLKSYKADDSFSGKPVHWILFDEEPPRDIWVECMMRLIDYGGVALVSATPTEGFTFLHDEVEKPAAAGSPDYFCASWSTYENPYIPRAEIERLSHGLTEEEKLVRIYGQCVALDGLPFFDRKLLMRLIREAAEPIRRDGNLAVWEEPRDGAAYVAGVDVSEGYVNRDASVVSIFRRPGMDEDQALVQVAELRVWTSTDELASQAERALRLYNEAWVYIESNNHGHAVIARMRDSYSRLLYQLVLDGVTKMHAPRFGFRTDPRTKPLLCTDLRRWFQPRSTSAPRIILRSRETLQEMEFFVTKRADRNRYGATAGRLDDGVIAAGLALQGHLSLGGFGLGTGAGAPAGDERETPHSRSGIVDGVADPDADKLSAFPPDAFDIDAFG